MRQEFFASFFSQHTRLIDIHTALPEGSLVVERFYAREALSEPFRFEIDCLSLDARLALPALLGEALTLRLLQADGSRRAWHGYVTEALQLGSDGGLARYRLIVGPWLAFLGARRDNHLFQDQTVLDILGQVFADYPAAHWASAITQPLDRHRRVTQYRETDLAFIERLLAQEGLSYRFEHEQAAAPGETRSGEASLRARHCLVLFDSEAELPDGRQPLIRYHRRDASEASDTLQRWHETRRVHANAMSLAGWDYKTLVATGAEAHSAEDRGALPRLEIHDAACACRFPSAAAAALHAGLALSAGEAGGHRFSGEGSVRSLAAGTRFTLGQHAGYQGEAARFSVLAVDHYGANNLGAQAARLLGSSAIEAGSYRNRVLAQPARLAVLARARPRPLARPQSALVVGPPGEALGTERDHHIKIQFPWQRGAAPNPGGRAREASGKRSCAPGDERSGNWVRVAEWLAGPNWGSHFLPRIGTEVLVDFLGGDIDRPVVVGQLHNGSDLPPFSAGVEGDANHSGVIAGWMSHNFAEGYNQWLVDDAPAQLRTRLASSGESGQLALGHLIHQAPRSALRGAWRGSGFELRSDGWLALRAGEGLLLSAIARPEASGTQLDAPESAARLKAALKTAQGLSQAAEGGHAQPLQANPGLAAFIQTIAPAAAPTPAGDAAPRFADPVLLAESPLDIGHATPASSVLFAAENLHASAGQDLHLASGETLATTVGTGASWFSRSGGIRSIAAAGAHSLQAHRGRLELLADQALCLTSSTDAVQLLAKSRIVLQVGQSCVTLEGGNITFACPGTFSVKGGGHAFLGPGSASPALPILPSSRVAPAQHDQFFVLRKANSGQPVARRRFRIRREDGGLQEGVTDAQGRSPLLDTATRAERLTLEILPEA